MSSLYESDLSSLTRLYRGKVRDLYDIDNEHILIVASDRLSAFDVVLPDLITGKGELLTQLSTFWFQQLGDIVPNHLQLATKTLADIFPDPQQRSRIERRAVVARKLRPVPVEAVVRGYLAGSGWKDYQADGTISGIHLPAGLCMAEQLPEPIFTPSTKAAIGDHDLPINFDQLVAHIGKPLAKQIRAISLALYNQAASYALERGIIIADTKFEFGLDDDDQLVLMDELFTPDSSRFWPKADWQVGSTPPSFDKQFIRDYLESITWDKTPPGPHIPADILEKTVAKYQDAFNLLTQ